MRASRLHLVHFKSAIDLLLHFDPGLNVLVGINGAGKSSVLDSLAIMLSWATARIRFAKAGGRRMNELDIHNEKASACIELTCQDESFEKGEISWRLTQTRKGRNPDIDHLDRLQGMTPFHGLNQWAACKRDQIGQDNGQTNIPVFVYYPVNRAVLDIPLRIRKKHAFDLLAVYDDALTTGANFRSFFEWYRNREDLENESYRESQSLFKNGSTQVSEDPQLKAVRKAITTFLPEFSKISVKRNPLRMEVSKGGETFRVDQMSDGEKCLFATVGDLARRLAIANPARKDALQGDGIVLIDEIDLHLHPAWQRMVVSKITDTFPNCQFVVSTHSPLIFGEVDAKCIRRLRVDPQQGLVAVTPDQAFGLDSSEVLEEQMETSSRNPGISDLLATIFRLIDEEKFVEATRQITDLKSKVRGDIPELVRAESLITMLDPDKGEPQ